MEESSCPTRKWTILIPHFVCCWNFPMLCCYYNFTRLEFFQQKWSAFPMLLLLSCTVMYNAFVFFFHFLQNGYHVWSFQSLVMKLQPATCTERQTYICLVDTYSYMADWQYGVGSVPVTCASPQRLVQIDLGQDCQQQPKRSQMVCDYWWWWSMFLRHLVDCALNLMNGWRRRVMSDILIPNRQTKSGPSDYWLLSVDRTPTWLWRLFFSKVH